MESAKKYIEDDDSFYLDRINCLELYLKCGITLFVSEFGQNFHDMTLIQYAIALRKPKVLKYMLETSYNKCQVPFDNIISPQTSNTKGNLLDLAIEFGSINDKNYGEKYKIANISCLEVIINFATSVNNNFSVDIENFNGETPLIKAIDLQNHEACVLLIKHGADILRDSQGSDFVKCPLWRLFEKANNLTILQKVISIDCLGDKYDTVIEEMNSDKLKEYLLPINNKISNDFINEFSKNTIGSIQDVTHGTNQPAQPQTKYDSEPAAHQSKCFKCKNPIGIDETKHCGDCEHDFCNNCINDHICKLDSEA